MRLYGWKKIDEQNYGITVVTINATNGVDAFFDATGELEPFATHPGDGRWFRSYSVAKRELLKFVRYKASVWRRIAREAMQSRKDDIPSRQEV